MWVRGECFLTDPVLPVRQPLRHFTPESSSLSSSLFPRSMVAKRDGKPLPTELPKEYSQVPQSGAMGAPEGETPVERELRLREAAQERMRAKVRERME